MQILFAELTVLHEYLLIIFYQLIKDDLQLRIERAGGKRKKVSVVALLLQFINLLELYPGLFLCGILPPINAFKTGT